MTNVTAFRHREAMALAAAEYRRFADLLDQLDEEEWGLATCCPGWSVREMVGHVLGSMRSSASQREQRQQLKEAQQRPGSIADALTELQIARTAGLSVSQTRQEIRSIIEPAVRGRSRVPAPLRRWVSIPTELPASGKPETWRLGYLVDTVLTRDIWMHRSDIALATGRTFQTTAEHDGRLVQLIVADWSRRHDRAFRLTLHGSAGGIFARGIQPVELDADTEAFCRALSGRGPTVPLATEVPF